MDSTSQTRTTQTPFVIVPLWVIDSGVSHGALRLYMTLATYANGKRNCWPTIARLAEDIGVSDSTVKRYVRELRDAGCIVTESRKQGGENLSNLYRLPIDPPRGVGSQVTPGGVMGDPRVGSQVTPKLEPIELEPEELNPRTACAADDRADELEDEWQERRRRRKSKSRIRDRHQVEDPVTEGPPPLGDPEPVTIEHSDRETELEEYRTRLRDQIRDRRTTARDRRARRPIKDWTAWDLATYFEEQHHSWGFGGTNVRMVASHIKRWLAEGLKPEEVKAMIDLFNPDGARSPARAFIASRVELRNRAQVDLAEAGYSEEEQLRAMQETEPTLEDIFPWDSLTDEDWERLISDQTTLEQIAEERGLFSE